LHTPSPPSNFLPSLHNLPLLPTTYNPSPEMATQKVPLSGGEPSSKDKVFEARASLTRDFAPLKSVCAHLNELHIYASSV
jgi:hypothetical protein